MTDSRKQPGASGTKRPLIRLWEMAKDEGYFVTYLFNPHPHNLDIVTRYTELLEERGAILRKMMEGYEGGATATPSATPTTPELLEYFTKSNERMASLLRRIYGITSPRALRKR